MTPLFPTPDYYLHNLIAMTSSEAKRLWRHSIKEHFDQTCIYCGKTYDFSQLTLDHVHPRYFGGKDDTKNIVCSCRQCNQNKRTTNWQLFISQFDNDLREKVILNHITA